MPKRRRTASRRKVQNRFSMLLVGFVVVLIIIVVTIQRKNLSVKIAEKQEKIDQLNAQIHAEELRAEEIEQYGKYVQTKAFAEEVAHEKLGLVYEGEIIFKQEK